MPYTRRLTPCLTALLTILLVAPLAACTSSDGDDTAKPTTSPSATSTVPSGAEDSDLDDPVGAVNMLADFSCSNDGGTWSGTAKLTNTGKEDATFEVTFTVIKTEGNAVVGSKTKTYELAAGESTDVEINDIYSGGKKDLQCVRRVLKGS